MKIIAMITARSSSSRFPRKHLALLGGKPMIQNIIENLRLLKHIDEIVLATTTKDTDNDLVELCMSEGISIFRGSEDNTVLRHGGVLDMCQPDLVIPISGDCPFMDIDGCQAVIDASIAHPDYDGYSIQSPYASSPEIMIAIHARSWFTKAFQVYEEDPTVCGADQYNVAVNLNPDRFSKYVVDGTDIIDRTVTSMKFSIDWRLEMEFFNAVIEVMGHYPHHITDFIKAFTDMRNIGFTWRDKGAS